MPARPASFLQKEVTRLLKGVLASGLVVAKVELQGDKIVVFGKDAVTIADESPLVEWRRKNGDG